MDAKDTVKPRIADSMAAAVAILERSADPAERLTDDDLTRAKAAGCPAFRGSRVYIDELVEWWEENADTLPTGNSEIDSITLELAREKLRKARFANDVEEGRFIRREDEAQKILALGLELKATLRKRLEEDFPDRQTMRTREEIISINRQLVDELCRIFAEGTKRWSQK